MCYVSHFVLQVRILSLKLYNLYPFDLLENGTKKVMFKR